MDGRSEDNISGEADILKLPVSTDNSQVVGMKGGAKEPPHISR